MNARTTSPNLVIAAASTLTLRAALAVADRYGPIVLLGAVTGLVAWLFARVFAGEPCGSDNSFHYGELARIAAAIRDGDWDWWNPGGNSGFASGYYYQVLPQALPAALSAATGLSPLICFQLGIFVPLVLAPAAAYRAVRVAGGTSWQAIGAAIAVPFAIGQSRWGHGADGTFLIGLYTQLWAFVAFPTALAHATRWIDEGRGLSAALAWGLFVGLCHPFAGVALGLAVFAGTTCVAIRWGPGRMAALLPWKWARHWYVTASPAGPSVRLVALGALLLLGSACAWLPVLVDYDGFGGFPHRPSDEVGPGFIELGRWIIKGQILDEGRAPAVMIATLPLVLYFARTRFLPRLWAAAVLYAFLLGIGPHLPRTGDDLLPPVRFIGALQVVLAMCAGIGVAALVEQVWRLRLGGFKRIAVCYGSTVASALAALIVVASGIGIHRERVKVAADIDWIARDQLGVVMEAMGDAPMGRLQVWGVANNHWATMVPYVVSGRAASLVMGGAALQSSPNYVYHWELLRDRDPMRAAWVFDSPLVITRPGEIKFGDVLKTTQDYELRALPSPGLVGPVQVVGELPPGRKAAREAAVEWLWSEMPFKNQVLAHHGSGDDGTQPRGRTVAVTRDGSRIRAEVEAEAATTFIVRESWHPRWRATLDGAPAPIRRVTPDYLAIDVPEAHHVIALRFDRPLWTWLLWLLWPGLVAAAWVFERSRVWAFNHTPALGGQPA
jgi:hypothetical protein